MTVKGAPVLRPKTRERILDACLSLFNERGPVVVTTAEIASAVGIQEGNLYYHFNRKEQILEALFDKFERALRDTSVADLAHGEEPGRFAGYLSGWFNLMWEWRFFYRDSAAIRNLAPALRSRTEALANDGQRDVRRVFGDMESAGLLRATPAQLDHLVVNTWIVSTYWIDYLRSRHGIDAIKRQHIRWGASQVMSLFSPYLTETGNDLLNIKVDQG
ncbi:TetR/AcrR family transcriptional regulator [Cupriavidus basilensis]|uniref:TetR/AcrR family transcriptional regulator n=1 Tax=Cupriavidus basilensis TaxID=68895 RepID=A0ABT6AKK0_9BURK|nr:TetR/AcrR family transcriptional regulator [Cupriavidus basilensis]MDF3833130.1 TetR/AcrR family transcriptional regulator [Cupriavidus basilensis]